jgi:hypothetical protein
LSPVDATCIRIPTIFDFLFKSMRRASGSTALENALRCLQLRFHEASVDADAACLDDACSPMASIERDFGGGLLLPLLPLVLVLVLRGDFASASAAAALFASSEMPRNSSSNWSCAASGCVIASHTTA